MKREATKIRISFLIKQVSICTDNWKQRKRFLPALILPFVSAFNELAQQDKSQSGQKERRQIKNQFVGFFKVGEQINKTRQKDQDSQVQ